MGYKYQHDFSTLYSDLVYDVKTREQKANKIVAVFSDYYGENLRNLSLLDIGCSIGVISNLLSKRFNKVVGIDIDKTAVNYGRKNYLSDNLLFSFQDVMNLAFCDSSFDVVICAHIYEHVPDCNRLFSEIYRVLKPGGVCYFSAGNRILLIEGHYKLPFLSIIPKPLAHLYLRILNKGNFYYENHLTLWELRKVVSRFEIIDYTHKIVENPQKYYITDLIQNGSFKQKISMWLLKNFYWLCPTYVWLLRKK